MKVPKSIPVHEYIKQQLRKSIEHGELTEGDLFPSENELARRFEVSRSLARQALRDLEIEGYIQRSQGARSRVAKIPRHTASVDFRAMKILALAFIGVQSQYTRTLVDGFTRQAFLQGYYVLTYNIWLHNDDQYEFLGNLRDSGVQGLGLWQDYDADLIGKLLRDFIDTGFPFIQIDRFMPELQDGDYVVTDNIAIGQRLTRSLLGRGHRRIAIVTQPSEPTSVRDRLQGYREALEHDGIAMDQELRLVVNSKNERATVHALRRMMQLPEPPTAFFCINEYMMSVLHSEMTTMGYTLGKDYELAVVDDSQLSERLDLPVIKAVQSAEVIGAVSAQCLISRILNPRQEPQHQYLKPMFFESLPNLVTR